MQPYLSRPPLHPIQRSSGRFGTPMHNQRSLFVPQRVGGVGRVWRPTAVDIARVHNFGEQPSAFGVPPSPHGAPHAPDYHPHTLTINRGV